MPTIEEIADSYEKEYGFMAVNATKQNAAMFHRMGIFADEILQLLKVRDELLRRGLKVIETKEEYEAGVKQHGIPPAFREKE